LAGFLAALQFLTIVPIKRGFTSHEIGQSSAFFPVVGIILGAVLLLLNYVLGLVLPHALVIGLLLSALVAMNGGLHLDGLADTLDGMAGHRTPERRLEIMRDSRIGGFGAVGLILVLLIEYLCLVNLPGKWLPFSLLLAPTLSRWAMVNAIFVYPYARPEGLGSSFKRGASSAVFWIATLIAIAAAVGLFRVAGLVVMAFSWLCFTLAALYFQNQIKGLTGDTYGAINEIALIGALLMLNVLSYKGWLL
jgi:adenosylcobinamide-GDP ribazoletransferase